MPPGRPTSTATGLEFSTSMPNTAVPYLLEPVMTFASHIGAGSRVLDVGCGNGYWSGEFSRRGYTVVGIDPSPTGIAIARQAHPNVRFEVVEVSTGLLDDLAEDPFDLVVSTEVVEHLYNPQAWAEACFRVLRPGGVFVSSTPYHGWLKDVALAVSGKLDRHHDALREGGHIKFFSRVKLESLLRTEGFEDIQFAGAGRIPFMWKSMVLSATRPQS